MMKKIKERLKRVYGQVPDTRCAGSGECCWLTSEEYANDYATMFPLYRAEYVNIVDYLQREWPEDRRADIFAFTEERPLRCPFLGKDNGCSIYSVRPLICRTYGVMNPRSIKRQVDLLSNEVPPKDLSSFAVREGGMVCARVSVLQPEKIKEHVKNIIDGFYERELENLSCQVDVAGGERRSIFRRVTGKSAWPVRWSWGGYNTVRFAPIKWLRNNFSPYWSKSVLADAG